LHWKVHAFDWQCGVALATPVVQTFPQTPQLLGSEVMLTQVPLQMSGVVPLQVPTQVDETQNVPLVHAFPHPMQLAGSLVRSTHAPLHSA
jgi:hypothetical protein